MVIVPLSENRVQQLYTEVFGCATNYRTSVICDQNQVCLLVRTSGERPIGSHIVTDTCSVIEYQPQREERIEELITRISALESRTILFPKQKRELLQLREKLSKLEGERESKRTAMHEVVDYQKLDGWISILIWNLDIRLDPTFYKFTEMLEAEEVIGQTLLSNGAKFFTVDEISSLEVARNCNLLNAMLDGDLTLVTTITGDVKLNHHEQGKQKAFLDTVRDSRQFKFEHGTLEDFLRM